MRELSGKEMQRVNGGWFHIVFAAARLSWSVYRHTKKANAATWAARGAGIAGTTYAAADALDPNSG
jgi:hypothetical protein